MTADGATDRLVEELRAAINARDDFLTIAAHELRNPMQAMSFIVESTLRSARQCGDADVLKKLERLDDAMHRYVRRATLLLDVSRISAGRRPYRAEAFDVAALLRDLLRTHEPEAAHHQVTLVSHLPESLVGHWDRLAIEQIAANLISNAIKYGADGAVEVALAHDGADVRLSVRDHGVGIPAEHQQRVFGQFEQVVGTMIRDGFGIGLWLVRQLVEAHGGSVALDSAPGQGSTFSVRLPLDSTPFLEDGS